MGTHMPLHDWSNLGGWDGFRHLWEVELLRHIKPQLAERTRVFIRTDTELSTRIPEPDRSIHIEFNGQLSAALEVVSPSSKACPELRAAYLALYSRYLQSGVHLLLVDVHPTSFCLDDALGSWWPRGKEDRLTGPIATAYCVSCVGEIVSRTYYEMTPGWPLPRARLRISNSLQVDVDLDGTYSRAAADSYLT